MRAPVRARIVMPVQFIPTLIAALQENLRIFSESHAPQPQGPRQGTRALRLRRRETRDGRAAHFRRARAALSGRRHRAGLPDAVRAARRDDPVGAVDRSAREHGHAGAVSPLPRRARAGRRRRRRGRTASSSRPASSARSRASIIGMASALVERHGGDVPADMDALVDAARRRPQDRERRARSRARRARLAGRSPRAARRRPSWARPRRRSREGRGARCARLLPPARWTKPRTR